MSSSSLGRRQFMLGAAGLAAGFGTISATSQASAKVRLSSSTRALGRALYGPIDTEPFPIPAVPLDYLDPRYYRQLVADPTGARPGTIVVDTPNRFLYLVFADGTAMRYGVGIGRDGFNWAGRGLIAYKREWPTWTPPAEMIARQPELESFRHGMAPGPRNPLGPRALYIFQNGEDTLYRLHGNPDVRSIGQAVSSGCVRLLFQDVIDLYERVPSKTVIEVRQ